MEIVVTGTARNTKIVSGIPLKAGIKKVRIKQVPKKKPKKPKTVTVKKPRKEQKKNGIEK
jgi:hypothetical protein